MKNLAKFLVFVLLLSAGISLLYDYRLKHGGLKLVPERAPEKYTLAAKPSVDSKQVASLEALNQERRTLIRNVIPAVVAVKTSKTIGIRREYGLDPFEFFFGTPRRRFRSPRDEALVQSALGSGVIVTNEGHIITNNHVVDQVDDIEVQLADGQTKKARLVGADPQADLAVLKIDNPGIKPLVLADSDNVQVGDFVLAIGNPFGFEETVTDGIISYKGRASDIGELLQTNAAINPGNSGGPLINVRGEVIGINTAIISTSGASAGVGFAIPSNTVRAALESLLQQGHIIRGYLGIQIQPQQPGAGNRGAEGVQIVDVMPGSPAAEAGLQPGDIIRKFNGREIKNFSQLRGLVAQTPLDKRVELEIVRNGKTLTVTTQIKEQPTNFQSARALPRRNQAPLPLPEETTAGPLGAVHVEELTPEKARQLDLPDNVKGVLISEIDPDAGITELQKGDVIEEINQQPISSVADYSKIAASLDPDRPNVLSVCRHRTRSFIVLRPQ
jgi:serine protease Do